ncbi:patatin-like phospholipase family protein [Halarcobacter anaerophilus]|jgi:NTE family protein|uniref:patatin-like phospholipase family protein n=1 Tax=Halarcobacter anaerophilus TaxID=877500 RepID=UPI0005C9C9A9|nr:patatin-like phospholipase family protein [Halarcobacter anaerophilus]
MNKKRVSLVLGSGGARGYAHIGVIEELEKNGYEIVSVSGSSMGALIGGLYACGRLQDYKKWVLEFDIFDILKLVDFSFGEGGMIKADRVFKKIDAFIKDTKIEELPISFAAVASDISKKEEVHLNKGSLKDAIRASIAIPTIFTPQEIEGRTLFDGGLCNPLPLSIVDKQKADLIIAVNLNKSEEVKKEHTDILEKKDNSLNLKILDFINNKSKKEKISYFEIVTNSIETMQEIITKQQIKECNPDIILNISNKICQFYEFHKAKETIEYGAAVTREFLENKIKEN